MCESVTCEPANDTTQRARDVKKMVNDIFDNSDCHKLKK